MVVRSVEARGAHVVADGEQLPVLVEEEAEAHAVGHGAGACAQRIEGSGERDAGTTGALYVGPELGQEHVSLLARALEPRAQRAHLPPLRHQRGWRPSGAEE